MNWKTLALTTGALLVLAPNVNAAKFDRVEHDRLTNISNMNHSPVARKDRRERGKKLERLLSQLDLTPEQAEQIKTIQAQSQTTAEELKEQLQTQRQEKRSLFAGEATTEEIRLEHQETEALARQLSNNRFETMLQIREILTSEQRAKMAELMESRKDKRFDS